jgi:hypothetical protein
MNLLSTPNPTGRSIYTVYTVYKDFFFKQIFNLKILTVVFSKDFHSEKSAAFSYGNHCCQVA